MNWLKTYSLGIKPQKTWKNRRLGSIRHFILFLSLTAGLGERAAAEETPELAALKNKYAPILQSISANGEERMAKLRKGYFAALEDLQRSMMSKGDLEPVLAVKAEIERVRAGIEASETEKKGMTGLLLTQRNRYDAALKLILDELKQKQDNVQKPYLRDLEDLQRQLTRRGDIAGATAVKAERERVLADLPNTASMPLNGLVLHYTFDSDTRQSIADKSGHGNNGKSSGATIIANGKKGHALSFAGEDVVKFSDRDLPKGNSPRTVALWFKITNPAQREVLVIWGKYAPGDATYLAAYEKNQPQAGKLQFGDWGGNPQTQRGGTTNVADGEWHHGALVYDGQGTARLFVDGKMEVEFGRTFATTLPGTATLSIGIGSNHGFTGAMDEVMIFNRALSAKEIREIYESQK